MDGVKSAQFLLLLRRKKKITEKKSSYYEGAGKEPEIWVWDGRG